MGLRSLYKLFFPKQSSDSYLVVQNSVIRKIVFLHTQILYSVSSLFISGMFAT